jgi:hypothetical protein
METLVRDSHQRTEPSRDRQVEQWRQPQPDANVYAFDGWAMVPLELPTR